MAKFEFKVGLIVEVLEGVAFGETVNLRNLVKYKVDSYNGSRVYLRPLEDKFPHHKPIRFNRRSLKSDADLLRGESKIILDPTAYFAGLDKEERLHQLRKKIGTELGNIGNEETLERLLEAVQEFGKKKK